MKFSADLVETSLPCPRTEHERQKRKYRTRLIMRVSTIYSILIVVSGLLIHAHAGYGQILEQRVNVGMDNEPLDVLFKRLEKQTPGISWLYGSIKQPTVSFPAGDRSLKETLELGLQNSGYTYEVKSNDGILILRETTPKNEDANKGSQIESDYAVTITGTIIDASNQQPMPGVNIIVKGTTRGTSSDANGNYTLAVAPDETLVFTFIGFKSVEEPINDRTKIDVALQQDLAMLKEVVVSGGYYETTDQMKTGSIVKVSAKDIEKQPVTSPIMALQGRVAGLEIIPSSGAPGTAPTIRIRGTNSLRQGPNVEAVDNGNYPLYIVDGVPISSMPVNSYTVSFTSGGYDPLSTINPANIESIQVLKDGDATAIYGSRGANGVILITTKRNQKSQERTNIEASVYSGIGQVSKRMNLLNTEQYLAMRNEALVNGNVKPGEGQYDYDLLYWDQNRQTDWQKVLIGNSSKITDVQSSIYSGTSRTSFRLSTGYHKETLVFPGEFGVQRLSTQLSLNHSSSNQKFKIGLSATYGLNFSKMFSDDGGLMGALTLPPNAPKLYNDDGTLNWEVHDLGTGSPVSTWTNPFSYLRNTQDTNSGNLISTTNISYDVVSGLVASINAGYTTFNSSEVVKLPRSAQPPESIAQGITNVNNNTRNNWIVEPKLTYSKILKNHSFDAVVGGTWQNNTTKSTKFSGSNYASDALLGSLEGAGITKIILDASTQYKYNSVYARIGYNFNQRYILNLTGRRDGSSRFGPNNRYGNFGAVGAGWIFSKETFLKWLTPIMSFGKLRASYGITGNDQIGDYNYYNLYRLNPTKYGGSASLSPSALYNPDFAWELTRKLEAAIEMSFADDRFGFELNWYRNRSSNQLVNYTLPVMTGFPSVLSNFNATVQNSGWELLLRADLLNSGPWSWNISLNASLPSNKLVKFDGIEDSPYVNQYVVNQPLYLQWLYTWKGVNTATGLYEVEDKNNDSQITDADRRLFDITGRKFFGGFTNTIRYKGFEIALLFQFSHQQGPRYFSSSPPGDIAKNQSTNVLKRWQHDGDDTDMQKFGTAATGEVFLSHLYTVQSNHNTTDASFIRLKTTSISYRFPRTKWLDKVRIDNLSIFVQGQNLWTLTNYAGLDPETGFSLPPLRMITVGTQLKF